MSHQITISTQYGPKPVTARKAILSAARIAYRQSMVHRIISAPRGVKGRLVALATAWRARRLEMDYDRLEMPMADRLRIHLLVEGLSEIERRQLSCPAGWDSFRHGVQDYSPRDRMWLITGEGWYEYSKRVGSYRQAATYLCGREDGNLWAVRVPSTIKTVGEALDWLTPAPIRIAFERGLPVRRQGDIYFRPVRLLAHHDMRALHGTRHEARPRADGGLTIVHPEHRPVVLSGRYTWRACQQRQIDGIGRRAGD